MKIQRQRERNSEIDLSAFADIAFLLIIFFVLTTTFLRPMGARISIPSGTTDPEQKPEEDLPTVNLTTDTVLLNEDRTTLPELRAALLKMELPKREEEKRVVILECTPDVDFQRYFQVVTAISHAGGILALIEKDEDEEETNTAEGPAP